MLYSLGLGSFFSQQPGATGTEWKERRGCTGFFCHLFGFNLMPRLKAIHKQKLYLPDTGQSNNYPNLKPIK